jgi:hypothetical protein
MKVRRGRPLKKAQAGIWGKWIDRSHIIEEKNHAVREITRAFVLSTNKYTVQISYEPTEIGIVTHLWIRRHDGETEIPWRDKQRIKREVIGDRTAIEVFPRECDLVDQADMYHLYVLPEGVALPFGLSINTTK